MRQILKNEYSGAMVRNRVRPQRGPLETIVFRILNLFKPLWISISGLKILGHDNIGRAGSIPARGTNSNNIKHLVSKRDAIYTLLSARIYAKMRNGPQCSETTMRPHFKCAFHRHRVSRISSVHSFKKLNHHIKTTSRGGSGEGRIYGEAEFKENHLQDHDPKMGTI